MTQSILLLTTLWDMCVLYYIQEQEICLIHKKVSDRVKTATGTEFFPIDYAVLECVMIDFLDR